MANNKIQVIDNVYPVTVTDAVYLPGTNTKLTDILNTNGSNNKWVGKKWIILGDRFSDSNSHAKYYNYTRDLTGLTILQNYGIGGLRYCNLKFETDDEGVDDGYSIIDYLDTFNLLNADVITIALGINDFFSCSPITDPLGDYGTSFDTDTFTGAMEYTLKYIHEKYREANQHFPLIILCTPTKSATVGETNRKGGRTEDYVNCIRKVADMWGLPVCEWISCGWNKYTVGANDRLATDACHPSIYGAERLGSLLANTIMKY